MHEAWLTTPTNLLYPSRIIIIPLFTFLLKNVKNIFVFMLICVSFIYEVN